MSSSIVLDDHKVLSILKAPDFYQKAPEFLFMKEMAIQSIERFKAREADCKECEARKLLSAPLHVFRHHVVNLHTTCGPQSLDNLVKYVEARLGYRPQPITMFYREGDETKRLDF